MTPPEFLINPTSANVAEGQQASFRCRHSTANTIGWSVNNVTTLNELSMMNIHVSDLVVFPDGSVQNELTFDALSQQNGSVIKCVALFIGDMPPEPSSEVVLLIQGPLGPPSNLLVNSTFITWDPPYSLDLTDVDPDIAYCVEVYDITCGRRDLIEDDCNVTESKISSCSLVPGYLHEIRITPRSNVMGAVNGTTLTVDDTFEFFQNIEVMNNFSIMDNFTIQVTINLELEFTDTESDRIRPNVYSLLISPSDGLDQNQDLLAANSSTDSSGRAFLRVTTRLQTRRRWDMVVLAYNCTEHILSDTYELSTHDVQALVHVDSLGELIITGYCIEGSMAIGMLAIVYSQTDPSDVSYPLITCSMVMREVSKSVRLGTTSTGLHTVSVFTVEDTGLPFPETAVRPTTVYLSSTGNSNYDITYELVPTDNGIEVTCKFLDGVVASYCVAIVHQKISHLNSSSAGLSKIESNYTFIRSGDSASGLIEGISLEVYQIGVIGGRQIRMEVTSSKCGTPCIIGIVSVALAVAVTVFVIALSLSVHYYRKRTSQASADVTECIKTDRCAAYEMTSLARQKVRMEENPAYQETGHLYAVISDRIS